MVATSEGGNSLYTGYSNKSSMEVRHKDCMPCRLASGSGIIGLGVYLFVQSRKLLRKPVQKNIIAAFAIGEQISSSERPTLSHLTLPIPGTVGLGAARLFDLLPKEELKPKEKKKTVAVE